VTGVWAAPVERCREDLRAARSLLEAGFPAQAVSRAYFAGLHVAEAALFVMGETASTDAGTISAFGRRVVGEGGLQHEAGRTLRKLFEDRQDVDYALAEAPADEARKLIEETEHLVNTTAAWIEKRERGR
jgi:uncharacterized protein (UPF0332 family)